MTPRSLRPDCARCAALCCVAPAFDRSAMFGFDKLAGEPCRHLDASHRCSIHDTLEASGFRGCVLFDCHGAGQYVTQELFQGRSWRDDPALLAPMMTAFTDVRAAHELLVILRQAERLPLPATTRRKLEAFSRRLGPARGWTLEDVMTGAVSAIVAEVRRFLPSLRAFVTPPPATPQT